RLGGRHPPAGRRLRPPAGADGDGWCPVSARRIAIDDLGSFDITPADGIPGHYVVNVGDAVELEATLAEFEAIAHNVLALVASQRLDNLGRAQDRGDVAVLAELNTLGYVHGGTDRILAGDVEEMLGDIALAD